jgi:alkanesulfonate monooxygenase SsuD/methylene tetrahydromethanopterin reductase-like flavin-dependent oxidoreductase (luciferase family)
MHYGVDLMISGDFADPALTAHLARTAEDAGWEGLFVWDHRGYIWGAPFADAWVTLAAAAISTERLRLGTAVTPLPQRKPHDVALALTSLDLLTKGRTILGAGLGGVAEEYTAFGEPGDSKVRAGMLDEGLEVLRLLWSGEEVRYRGTYYTVDGATLAPLPVQRPRIPAWIGGESRSAMRRAARWDGWIASAFDGHGEVVRVPEDLARDAEAIRRYRAEDSPFDIALIGQSAPGDRATVGEYAAAGATWWLEHLHGLRGSREELLARVAAGPPA